MDQSAALRWVRAASRAGGDPDKVVIIGQSAGAASVAAHIFSPSPEDCSAAR
jgi:para-nitrobenzyl esterase